MNEVEQIVKKIENLQHEYAKLNQFSWKTNNDLTCLQVDLEWMTRDYAKMEKYNLEQQGTIIGLERTCEDLKEQ